MGNALRPSFGVTAALLLVAPWAPASDVGKPSARRQSRLHKRDVLLFLLAVTLCFVVVGVAFVPRVYFESVWLLVREVLRSITH